MLREMSEKQLLDLYEKIDTLLKIRKAPSQFQILFYLISSGRTLTVKELSSELSLTPKATERAVAKLVEKSLIQRSSFKDGGYNCDTKNIILSLLVTISDLYEDYERRNPQIKIQLPVSEAIPASPASLELL